MAVESGPMGLDHFSADFQALPGSTL